jgi:hypothetical protein
VPRVRDKKKHYRNNCSTEKKISNRAQKDQSAAPTNAKLQALMDFGSIGMQSHWSRFVS